jgi:hypothetical protein
MSEKMFSSAVVIKCLTNENLKPDEILMRLRAQLGDKTLSKIQVHDWSKSLKEGRTEVANMRRLYTFCRERYGQSFLGI